MILNINGYKKGVDDNFVTNCIPKIIGNRIKGVCASKDTRVMDEYLKKMYGITTIDVVREVAQNIDTNWYGSSCQIGINTNIYNAKSQQRLESLMKLIDTGNTDVKGLGIFREALMYITYYINAIHKVYLGMNTIRQKEEGN